MASSSSLLVSPSSLSPSNSLFRNRNTIDEKVKFRRNRFYAVNGTGPVEDSTQKSVQLKEEEIKDPGVKIALCMLKFYKREISPVLPRSCRYVPTCSEYSMEAYKKYGFVKGTVLTTWRVCRCNPFGGFGYDPPRWFDEEREKPSSDR